MLWQGGQDRNQGDKKGKQGAGAIWTQLTLLLPLQCWEHQRSRHSEPARQEPQEPQESQGRSWESSQASQKGSA